MTNKEKYAQAFAESLEVDINEVEELKYQTNPNWDSVGHMNLITTIEDVFDIMMDTDDIIDLSSYEKGMEILSTKYDIEF